MLLSISPTSYEDGTCGQNDRLNDEQVKSPVRVILHALRVVTLQGLLMEDFRRFCSCLLVLLAAALRLLLQIRSKSSFRTVFMWRLDCEQARSQNCEKRLLGPYVCLCPSVLPNGTTRLPLDGFS